MLLLTVSFLMGSVQPSENDVLGAFLEGSGFGPFFDFSGDRRLRSGEATVFDKCF